MTYLHVGPTNMGEQMVGKLIERRSRVATFLTILEEVRIITILNLLFIF